MNSSPAASQATLNLFDSYLRSRRRKERLDARDQLLRRLHEEGGVPLEDLARCIRLKKRSAKEALKRSQAEQIGSGEVEEEDKRRMEEEQIIKDVVMREIKSKRGLVTIPRLKQLLAAEIGLKPTSRSLTAIMKSQLGLKWRAARAQAPYVNSAVNVQLRLMFTEQLLALLEAGKVLLNFDETMLGASTS